MKKTTLKWSPAAPSRRPDNIISSKARENGEAPFKASYETDRHIDMSYIMSNEYMRIWFKELKRYEIDIYSKEEVQKVGFLKRRAVQHNLIKRVPMNPLPIIQLKRFSTVGAKTENKRPKK